MLSTIIILFSGILTRDISTSSSGSNGDYVPLTDEITDYIIIFGIDESTQTITIPILDDNDFEGSEVFEVVLKSDKADEICPSSIAIVIILNDDGT